MQKVRVYQLAKELKVQSALILELLDRLGHDVKSDLSTLDLKVADLVRDKVTLAISQERKRLEEERQVEEEIAREEALLAEKEKKQEPAPAEPVAAEPAEPAAEEKPAEAPEPVTVPEPAAPAVPVAAKPATPAAPPVAPTAPAATPGIPERPVPIAAKTTATAPPTPGVPGARKPRVFPARRIPTPASLKPKPKPAPRTVPPTGARPPVGGRPPLPPRQGPLPDRPHRPHKKRRRKDKSADRANTPMAPTRPKPELPPVPEKITLSEGVTVKELAEKLERKSKDVIAKLIPRGVLATINQPLDPQMAIEVAKEFGSTATIVSFEEEAQRGDATGAADDIVVTEDETPATDLAPRPPVVTVMGHVDHGKTSLLDAIRTTNVVDREAGGITQHIGAYQVEENGQKITFLDTPGHEAFTLMRARGARATDIVVLVVAADDGVKPQTLEAIDHAQAAKVPLVVAVNKIDKPGANTERVKQQLAERELLVEEYGGTTVCCEVSAKQRTGLDELLEMILLVADMKELQASPTKPATGVVLEARRDRSKGVLATVLVQEGTLKIGDAFIAGASYGKVRAMTDEHGRRTTEAGPSTPVEVMGFATEAGSGDSFQIVSTESKARQIASFRQEKARAEKQRKSARRSLESLAADIAAGEVKELPVLLKADVHGSVEAIEKALADLPTDKVRVGILRSSIGAITQADVLLAAASNAIIVGFNVRPDKGAADLAKQEGVDIRPYTVIYSLLDEIKSAMVGLLEPTYKENILGQAEVRQLFKVPKIGFIAGCYVTGGKVTRKAEVRLLRENVVIYTGKVGSLRRFKDDVAEVKQGYECGIGIEGYNNLKESDVIEFFEMQRIEATSL
ncbi:MAG: translation initiation factor IF-2 [bacterium]|nr:translation initiation factor IF-2 [bacterium]